MSDVPARLREAPASRYAIEREIGAGGIATVYAAHDLRHRRPVAIKVLRPDLASALGAERFLQEIETSSIWLAQLGEAYGLTGQSERALAILEQLREKARTGYVSPYHLAYVYTGLGRYDEAIDCLEQAYEKRAGAVYGIKGSFLFKPLHGQPRFSALLRRMNLT